MTNYRLLKDAYYGEGGFLDGSYLRKHKRETQENFTERTLIAFYENYFANIVNALVNPIFRKEPIRDWDKKTIDFLDTFTANVDYAGTPIQSFMQDAALRAKLLGAVFICVESDGEGIYTNAQDVITNRRMPYAYVIEPEFVKDYKLDKFGRLQYLKCVEKLQSTANLSVTKVTEFDAETIRTSIDNQPVSVVKHGLGRIPIVYFPANVGSKKTVIPASEMEPLAHMAKNQFNKQSWLDEILKNQTFSLLLLPDPSVKNLEIGTNNALAYSGADTGGQAPSFIAPPDGPAQTLIAEIKRITENMYRVVGLSFIIGAKQEASGVSKQWDFERVNQELANFAQRCAAAEREIITLFSLWLKEDFNYSVEYPKDFGIVDILSEIQTAQSVLDLDLLPNIRLHVLKKVLGVYFPDLSSEDFDFLVAQMEARIRNEGGSVNE